MSEGNSLHPEARNWLEAIQCPDLLEAQTLTELQRSLERDGYDEAENEGEVTIGWGCKTGEANSNLHTMLAMCTSDNKLVSLSVGGKGSYGLNVWVNDINHPAETELALIRSLSEGNILRGNYNSSNKARTFFRQHVSRDLWQEADAGPLLPGIECPIDETRGNLPL